VRESRPKPTQATLTPEVGAQDHVLGPPDAAVTLVEYGDFECEFCGRAYPELKRLLKQVGGKVRFIFRHFPIPEEHPHAQHAAEVAEAAAAQGKFWEMHDLLFEHQDALRPMDLVAYAGQLGLDVDRFTDELRRRVYASRVADDIDTADQSGVTGTPTFFVNGRRQQGSFDIELLEDAVRGALQRARLSA
jgi:protein-disulfide isomerase